MSEREEVLTYFGWQTCVMGDECCHDECRIPVQMADEIVRLRGERDALRQQLAVVGVAAHGGDISDVPSNYRTDTSDKVVKLARILAALREPSEAVVKAVKECIYEELGIEYWDGKTRRIMYYAIEAAEKEASA